MAFFEYVAMMKDVVVAGAAISGAIIARQGLNTWRRQLKGQSEYELSRRILVTLFKYRDAINSVRYPLIHSGEMSRPSEDDAKNMSLGDIEYYKESKAYESRWDRVYAEKKLLYADLLEAEAIWGCQLNGIFQKIYDLESELKLATTYRLILIDPKEDGKFKDFLKEHEKSSRLVLYDFLGSNPDAYKVDMATAIDAVEAYLKPKLTHEEVSYDFSGYCKILWGKVSKRVRSMTSKG